MCKGGDVKERDEESHETEEKACSAEHEGSFTKGRDVKKFSACRGKDALAHDEVGDDECEQGNKSDNPSCPSKADPGMQRMK